MLNQDTNQITSIPIISTEPPTIFTNVLPKTSIIPHPPRGAKSHFRYIINTENGIFFKKYIKEGYFQRGSNFIEDLEIVSGVEVPKETQKRIFVEILNRKLDDLDKNNLEHAFESLNKCGTHIRSKLFGRIIASFFNKYEKKKLTNIIKTLENEKTGKKVIEFEKLYCGDKECLNNVLNCSYNIAYSFGTDMFEEVFLLLLNLSLKFNGNCIKRNYLQKGSTLINFIETIIDLHENRKILDSLIRLAERKRTNERSIEIFKEIYEIAVWETEENLLDSINKRI